MKLLLDQFLSRRLIAMLAAEYPRTEQVLLTGKEKDEDTGIRDYSASNGWPIDLSTN